MNYFHTKNIRLPDFLQRKTLRIARFVQIFSLPKHSRGQISQGQEFRVATISETQYIAVNISVTLPTNLDGI